MGRVRQAILLGLATSAIGALFSLVPAIASLEDTVGLRILFGLRGPLPSPPALVVVSIDDSAAVDHARVIDRLVERGASVIAFDVELSADGSAGGDAELASAIQRSQRVIWRQQDPRPEFLAFAAGLAPAPIPDAPLVTSFRTFVGTSAEEVPTLPAVALQVLSSHAVTTLDDELVSVGIRLPDAPSAGNPDALTAYMGEVRRQLKNNAPAVLRAMIHLAMRKRLDDRERQRVRVLARLYARDPAVYLNFYGPPGTICTVPYELLKQGAASPCPLENAAVFVGPARMRANQAGQRDTRHTIYERSDGADFSNVELQATAFSNLMTGTALRRLSARASLYVLLVFGFVLGGSTCWVRIRRRSAPGRVSPRVEAAIVATLLASAFGLLASVLFAYVYVIVPVVIPLAVQFPAAVILALLTPSRSQGAPGGNTAGAPGSPP